VTDFQQLSLASSLADKYPSFLLLDKLILPQTQHFVHLSSSATATLLQQTSLFITSLHQHVPTSQFTTINQSTSNVRTNSKMPPKVAKAEKAEKSAAPKVEEAFNPESKLMWAVLCELSKEGKIAGINWEEVKGPIEATTGHAAR
jgi:hypothetical protein